MALTRWLSATCASVMPADAARYLADALTRCRALADEPDGSRGLPFARTFF